MSFVCGDISPDGPPPPDAARGEGTRDPFEAARACFPTLRRRFGGRRLVYLDTAATALRPQPVIDAEARFSRDVGASAHRGLHPLAAEATAVYEGCRERVARWLGAASADAVVITRNATAALNLVARGLEPRLRFGDEVLLTEMEHHSNLVPWLELARRVGGVRIKVLPVLADGTLDLAQLRPLLGPRTRVVALTQVSNVLGTVNPVAEVAEAAHRVGALVVVDAAQAAGHVPVSLRELGADLVAVSAHKCYGPMGLGFLAGRPEALERLDPLESGGQMIDQVRLDGVDYAPVPRRFEAGTANVAAAAAFPPALDLLDELGQAQVRRHEVELVGRLREALAAMPDVTPLGPADPTRRGGLVSFHDPRVHPHDMATILGEMGVAVRAGHHCAQPLHRRLGVAATVRASFGVYSTADDVDALLEGIAACRKVMAS